MRKTFTRHNFTKEGKSSRKEQIWLSLEVQRGRRIWPWIPGHKEGILGGARNRNGVGAWVDFVRNFFGGSSTGKKGGVVSTAPIRGKRLTGVFIRRK